MLPMGMMKSHIKSHFDDDVSLVRYVQGSSGLEPTASSCEKKLLNTRITLYGNTLLCVNAWMC